MQVDDINKLWESDEDDTKSFSQEEAHPDYSKLNKLKNERQQQGTENNESSKPEYSEDDDISILKARRRAMRFKDS